MSVAFHKLKIAELRRETADAISVLFEVPAELVPLFGFRAGQHLTLRNEIAGADVRRNYSVCASPHEDELRIAIKHIPGGVFSTWANGDLREGALIDAMPPHGSFTWNFDAQRRAHYAAFAGGSGITPILSLLKTAMAEEPLSQFTLVYGNRTSNSIMFLEELAALKNRFLDRLDIYHVLDEEEQPVELFNGRLDAHKIAEFTESLIDPAQLDAVFICGPGPMMQAVEDKLMQAGVPADRIRIERFTVDRPSAAQVESARQLEQQAQGHQVRIVLEGRRRSFVFDADKGSILENAHAIGMPTPYACKAGVCATCRAKVISGEVQMKANYGLSPEEIAQGYVLTCQAVPCSDEVTLDFDT